MEEQRRVALAMQLERMTGFSGNVMTDDQVEETSETDSRSSTPSSLSSLLKCTRPSIRCSTGSLWSKNGKCVYGDLLASSGNKVTARQRWTPTGAQLEILERNYDEDNGTPGKDRVKEITMELSEHGQVSGTNVTNWFQKRRACFKRKKSVPALINAEPNIEPKIISTTKT